MIRYSDKKFWGKIVKPTSSVIPNIFRYPKPFETQKGSSTNWWRKIVKPTSSLIPNIFRYPKETQRVPLRNDSVDKTILVENRNTRPLSYPERFSIPEINETLKNSKIFSTVSSETLIPPPSYPWIFRYPKLFWNTEGNKNFPSFLRSSTKTDSVLWN